MEPIFALVLFIGIIIGITIEHLISKKSIEKEKLKKTISDQNWIKAIRQFIDTEGWNDDDIYKNGEVEYKIEKVKKELDDELSDY